MWNFHTAVAICLIYLGSDPSLLGASLTGTSPSSGLDSKQQSVLMMESLHQFAQIYQNKQISLQPKQWEVWNTDEKRLKLREMLGANLKLSSSGFHWRDSMNEPSILAENSKVTVRRIYWKVLDSLAGDIYAEGIWIKPKGVTSKEIKLVLPDADQSPESFLGLGSDELIGETDWRVGLKERVVMRLINRDYRFSYSEPLQRQVMVNHREWIHRQSFGLGRTLTGYEVLSAEAAIDAIKKLSKVKNLAVEGHGEGARIALFTAALRDEVEVCELHGGFGPQDRLWSETLDRSLQGYLKNFGDAAVASMIAPRKLILHHSTAPTLPEVPLQNSIQLWAPGQYRDFSFEEIRKEMEKSKSLAKSEIDWIQLDEGQVSIQKRVLPEALESASQAGQRRLVKQWSQVSQRAVRELEMKRSSYWRNLLIKTSLIDYETKIEPLRQELWKEVLGKLPDPQSNPDPKSRLLYETDKVRVYELCLEVSPHISLWSWVGIPKSLNLQKEKAPVVVCQHGLEGLPEHVFTTDPKSRYNKVYKSFALKLAEKGYITVAPHMPYRGEDEFRLLQRKLNASGLTLYSIAIHQHQQLLRWLQSQPYIDNEKIGFYGLSYGGKIAMRIPAVLTDYKFSICSGDFNDWIMKLTSNSFPASYIFTKEYEIWEWNLAKHFNHSEMASLVAPRAFMVEYGHRDGVSASEFVGYEYGKVKRLYDRLGISAQTQISLFDGPHEIHGKESFEFIDKQFGIVSDK